MEYEDILADRGRGKKGATIPYKGEKGGRKEGGKSCLIIPKGRGEITR